MDSRPWPVRLRRSYRYLLVLLLLMLLATLTTILATTLPTHIKSPAIITLSLFLLLFLLLDLLLRYKTEQYFFARPSNSFDLVLWVLLVALLLSVLMAQTTKVEGLQGGYLMALCVLITRCATRMVELGFSLRKRHKQGGRDSVEIAMLQKMGVVAGLTQKSPEMKVIPLFI